MIPEITVNQIKERARIEDFAHNPQKAYGNGKQYSKCPECLHIDDKKKSGLIIYEKKQTAKCFKCGAYYSNPIDYIMKTENLEYPEALRFIADYYTIIIEEAPSETPAPSKTKKASAKKPRTKKTEKVTPAPETETPERKQGREYSFCDRQLLESGIHYDDIRVTTTDESGTIRYISSFIQGTRDQYGNVLEHKGDDVLIKYFDLDGNPVMYRPPRQQNMKPLIRVRWKNPAAHPDKNGRPIKYQSPAGSGSHIYIPQKLREMYKQRREIKTLYIQEGEKKAEKSCKHGIWSVGIMGIQNLGSDGRLPDEIQMIVEACKVEQVNFILDADWNQLNDNLKNGQSVDNRPYLFFLAVKSYKEYLRTLANLGTPVEIYFSNIRYNEENPEKGIDDLLAGSLKDKENELLEDFETAYNDKNGAGKYVEVRKITMLPDVKIADFWLLNDADAFAKYHRKRLENLKEFQIKKLLRRFDDKGNLELAQKLLPDEKFWDEDIKVSKTGDTKTNLMFNYVNAMRFLQNRGFFRFQLKSGEKILIHNVGRVIHEIDHTDVKDFVKNFCREIKEIGVLNMLMRGGPQYLGPEKLTNLDIATPLMERPTMHHQHMFFKDKIWEITADGIKEMNYGQFSGHVWADKVINFKAKALPPLIDVMPITPELREKMPNPENYKDIDNGEFLFDFTENGKKCHFLQFLYNTSNFTWRKEKGFDKNPITQQELFLNARHLVNKLTLIGYLLHDCKNDNERKAVILMDGKMSEVGASNGRSGKSLIGKAIDQVIPQVYVDGKDKKIDDDQFRYHEVTEKTKNLFFDDVRVNFDFESLFSVITGKMTVNQKSGLRFTLQENVVPKILVTTNHALNGEGSSFRDRQAFGVCSDYYNDDWKPVNDFGVTFWSEWESDQYNLFYNCMATCLVIYFRSLQNRWSGSPRQGIVSPPDDDVQRRKYRQIMGENFFSWAEAFFDYDEKLHSGNLNQRHERKELYDAFLEYAPQERKFTTATRFREKILAYCRYKAYHFNPSKPNKYGVSFLDYRTEKPENIFIGEMDKSGGREYFTVANNDFTEI